MGAAAPTDDLQVIRTIERVTGAGRKKRCHGAIDCCARLVCRCRSRQDLGEVGDIFFPESDCFEHQIEIPAHRVDHASAEIIVPQVAIVYVGEKRSSSVEVQRYACD